MKLEDRLLGGGVTEKVSCSASPVGRVLNGFPLTHKAIRGSVEKLQREYTMPNRYVCM